MTELSVMTLEVDFVLDLSLVSSSLLTVFIFNLYYIGTYRFKILYKG